LSALAGLVSRLGERWPELAERVVTCGLCWQLLCAGGHLREELLCVDEVAIVEELANPFSDLRWRVVLLELLTRLFECLGPSRAYAVDDPLKFAARGDEVIRQVGPKTFDVRTQRSAFAFAE